MPYSQPAMLAYNNGPSRLVQHFHVQLTDVQFGLCSVGCWLLGLGVVLRIDVKRAKNFKTSVNISSDCEEKFPARIQSWALKSALSGRDLVGRSRSLDGWDGRRCPKLSK